MSGHDVRKEILSLVDYVGGLGDWVTWCCPECGTEHDDPEYIDTHCSGCGRVYLIGPGGQPFDLGERVEIERE